MTTHATHFTIAGTAHDCQQNMFAMLISDAYVRRCRHATRMYMTHGVQHVISMLLACLPQDERIQMAFHSSSHEEVTAGSRNLSVAPPDLSPSASYPLPDTPRLDVQRRQASDSTGQSRESANVFSVTKNLENMGFGSPA